ncbi:MAG TPA: benzoylformate decarboxylase [Hyphomicrobiales bacterium]|nr:benzoylformate decarboxylase [Hyphomicrobiales bacterium]
MMRDRVTTRTTVRDATLALMRQLGMTTVFGNPGSTELLFLDRWPDDFRYVLALQEASAVAMADGYARATGRAAFVNLHSAAGVGHSLGNLFSAFRNHAPLVVTAGQQARALLPNLPFLGASEAPSFPRPYVKWSIEPARAADVPAAIAHAYYVAMQRPRGPTFVSIPSDDWSEPCLPVEARTVADEIAPDPRMIAEAARLIAAAKRIALVVGPEVDEEGAGPALEALAERLSAAVWASPFSARVSFPEHHPLFAGFLDAAPQAVSDVLMGYDLVLVVGAPVFTFHVPGDCALFRSGIPIVQLTTDGEAAASAPAGMSILGSMTLAIPALTEAVPATRRRRPPAHKRVAAPAAREPIPVEYLFDRLAAALPKDAIVVEEAPSHRPAMHDHLPIRSWRGFYTMASGGLGYSLPASAGIALAEPGRRVVCVIGDGSMMYSVQALWSAVQHRLPVTVVVIDNAGYGAMRSFSRVLQVRGVPGIELPGLDFVKLAEGMGCPARRVTKPKALGPALNEALAADGPMLLSVAIDATVPVLYHDD